MKKILALAAISLLVLAAACARPTNNANSANHNASANTNAGASSASGVSDSWITAKAKLALIADSRTSGFETDVTTTGGTTTLSGKVETEQAKTAASEVVKGIEGVKGVNNQLQVVPEAKQKEVNATDDKIEDEIEKAMDTDPALNELSLSASSNAGVVTLEGTVDSQDELVKAAQAVRKIAGVKSVVTSAVTVTGEKKY